MSYRINFRIFPRNTYCEAFSADHKAMKNQGEFTRRKGTYSTTSTADSAYLTKFAQKKLCFSYGKVSYQEFAKLYKKQNSTRQKLLALPKALWSLAKAISNIFHAMFTCSKVRSYHAARDLQAALGYLISPFHETKGAYWTERSAFHKACYEAYAGNLDGSISGTSPLAPPSTKTLSLKEFTSKTEEERNTWIEDNLDYEHTLYLRKNIKKFEKELGSSLSNRAKEVDADPLEKIHLDDLFLAFDESKSKFIFMSPEKLKKMTQETLSKLNPTHKGQLEIALYRLRQLAKTEPAPTEEIEYSKRPLIQFVHLTPEQIKNKEESLPEYALGVFEIAQLKHVTFSKLSKEQVNCLYLRGIKNLPETLDQFSDDDLIEAVKQKKFVKNLFGFLPDKLLPKLPLEALSTREIELLFYSKPDRPVPKRPVGTLSIKEIEILFYSKNLEENKKRFALLPTQGVLKAIEQGTLQAPKLLTLISDTQLKEIGAQLKEIPDYLSKCLTEKQIKKVKAGQS